jgi:hypothetical protein
MWTVDELIKFILAFDRAHKASAPAPMPEPEPVLKPEPVPACETEMQRLQRFARDDVRAGRAVGMNDMLRSIPRTKPPRKPSWDC